MLLAAVKILSLDPDFEGKIHCVFQPAEEGGAGGKRMVEEGLFDRFPAESVWGLHNLPGTPLGKFGTRPGFLMAATVDFRVFLTGRGGHAAMPHLGTDPVLGAAPDGDVVARFGFPPDRSDSFGRGFGYGPFGRVKPPT